MNNGFFSIPCLDESSSDTNSFLNEKVNSIMNTMQNWCCKNKGDRNQKGFLIYGYNVDSHLKLLKFPKNVLQDHLYKTSADSHETVIVYNAMVKVILLIRIAVDKDIEHEIKLSTNDMTKFALTFHDVLNKSGVKLINLLATDEGVNYESRCESCNHQIISMENFSSSDVYQKWWKKKKYNFGISVIHGNLNKKFSFELSAKALGFLTYLQLSRKTQSFNTINTLPDETIYMTPTQTKIVYSPQKHVIINDCSGSGKLIVARKKAEIIMSRLKSNESFYYIRSNSSSFLGREYQLCLPSSIDKVTSEPEIATVKRLLKEDSEKAKLNLIFDGFVSDNLNEIVTKELNHLFETNEKLKDSDIIIIPQELDKKIGENNRRKKGNYEMLRTFSQSEKLVCNMKKAPEIERFPDNIIVNASNLIVKEEERGTMKTG